MALGAGGELGLGLGFALGHLLMYYFCRHVVPDLKPFLCSHQGLV